MFQNTQLTSAIGYKTDRIIFSKPVQGSVPNTPITYKRINIGTKNEDGTSGELILETIGSLFSFGISPCTDPKTNEVTGYSMGLCLWDKDNASSEEKEWTDVFTNIVEKCKDYLVENRDQISRFDLERGDLKKLNPLYWKKDDKGRVVDNAGPILSPKLIQSKKLNKVLTNFYNENGEEINFNELIKKRCYVKGAIKIESIFIGKDIYLQVKLYEAEVRMIETGVKKLLKRPTPRDTVTISNDVKPTMFDSDNEEDEPEQKQEIKKNNKSDDDDTGSINGDSESESEEEPKKKSPVKRTSNRVAISSVAKKLKK
jgi:hypothetical protein